MAESNYFNQAQVEWLAARRGKLTSSEIHKIFTGGRKKGELFGAGAITYIRSRVDEITSGEVKEEMDFKQTEWGKANEADAIFSFEDITGLHVEYHGISNPKFYPYGDFAGGSPDGEVIEYSESAIVECKCHFDGSKHLQKLLIKSVSEFKDTFWEEYCQDQMNMIVSSKQNCYSISYDPRKLQPELRTKIIRIPLDKEWVTDFILRHDAAVEMMADILSNLGNNLWIK